LVAGPGSIDPEGIFDGLRWGAIFYGVVLDTVLGIVLSIPMCFLLIGPEFLSENEAVANAAAAKAYESVLVNLAFLVYGLSCTLIGAFFGARRAGSGFVRHGGWVGVGSVVVGAALHAALPEGPAAPLVFELLGFVLLIPAGALGGQLAASLGASTT
jgi:hypothetical protein